MPRKRPVGRPIVGPMRRVLLTLDEPSIDAAKALGKGNASEGVRIALKPHSKKKPKVRPIT